MFCLLRARRFRYCERSEASTMRRLRYICGGEEGSVTSGSEAAKGILDVGSPDPAFSSDGAGEADLEVKIGIEVPGGGAPLTIWSSFESDMVRESYNHP